VLHEEHGDHQPISIEDSDKTLLFFDLEDKALILNFMFLLLTFRVLLAVGPWEKRPDALDP